MGLVGLIVGARMTHLRAPLMLSLISLPSVSLFRPLPVRAQAGSDPQIRYPFTDPSSVLACLLPTHKLKERRPRPLISIGRANNIDADDLCQEVARSSAATGPQRRTPWKIIKTR
ncbi:hypothetical protein BJV77DRAFT_1036137 [Russula vinacea]|nr:hypothetical protein BJV77DRAFT_1036137 [Russula vinacea]